ncbi:MAG: NUDIX hydrolase [Burkholderiales bacterium]
MVWKPNVTVAAVIERKGEFLFVEEKSSGSTLLFNQPAGHLERGESLIAAVVRETLEETAYHFSPTALTGIYQWRHPQKDISYLRFTFTGDITGHEPKRRLDHGIVRAAWMTPEMIRAHTERHRSPLVAQCLEDYLAGKRYPLDLLAHFD